MCFMFYRIVKHSIKSIPAPSTILVGRLINSLLTFLFLGPIPKLQEYVVIH